jgi:hypothetical protein
MIVETFLGRRKTQTAKAAEQGAKQTPRAALPIPAALKEVLLIGRLAYTW